MTDGPLPRLARLADRYRQDLTPFTLFLLLGLALRAPELRGGSSGGLEQWVNLTSASVSGGQDFFFSYGPLYWLLGGTTVQTSAVTYWAAAIVTAGFSAALWTGLLRMARRTRTVPLLAAVFLLLFDGLLVRQAPLLLPLVLVALLELGQGQPRRLSPRLVLVIGALCGLAFYLRFVFGMVGVLVLGAYLVHGLVRRRDWRAPLGLLAGTSVGYVAVGLLVFGSLQDVVAYTEINLQLSSGNSTDMTLAVPSNMNTLALSGLLVLFLCVAIWRSAPALLLPCAGASLIFFKLGFGRADHYLAYFVLPVSVLALIAVAATRWHRALLSCVAVLLLVSISSSGAFPGGPVNPVLAATRGVTSASYEDRLASTYPEWVLDKETLDLLGRNAVDVYPYNNEIAFANRLNYRHRPVFQGFMTLTPELGRRNAAFFRSAQRPRFVLWTAATPTCTSQGCNPFHDIDGKFVLNEDPLTTRAILQNYAPRVRTTTPRGTAVLVLEARNTVVQDIRTTVQSDQERLGQWVAVPRSASPLVMVPKLSPTRLATLKNLLFRGNALHVEYRLTNGTLRRYRLNTLNADEGIIASPLPDSLNLTGEAVSAMRILAPSRYYHDDLVTTWQEVTGLPLTALDDRPRRVNDGITRTCSGFIDSASAVESPTGDLLVKARGWVLIGGTAPRTPVVTVLETDGTVLALEATALPRPDVVAALANRGALLSGFDATLRLPADTPLPLRVSAGARDARSTSLCPDVMALVAGVDQAKE